jgi:glycosyltransferase involved in cell wall biosynthesis
MLKNKTIAVVVPAYNEETQIGMVIESMPDFVDRIIIVNDKSKDNTAEIVKQYIQKDTSPKTIIPNILDNIKPNRYNRANLVLQDYKKKKLKNILLPKLLTQIRTKTELY